MGDDLISREKAPEVVKRHMCDSARIEQGILELQTAYSIDKVAKQINEEGGMERLTKRNEQNTKYYYPKCFEKCGGNGNSANCNSCELEDMICEKLGRYEDLEEKGLLLRLPCKVGDTVYAHEVDENDFEQFHCGIKISEIQFEYWMIMLFGTCIFNTREEAEAALHIQGGITVKQDNHIKND